MMRQVGGEEKRASDDDYDYSTIASDITTSHIHKPAAKKTKHYGRPKLRSCNVSPPRHDNNRPSTHQWTRFVGR
jgi:hypothetical protein